MIVGIEQLEPHPHSKVRPPPEPPPGLLLLTELVGLRQPVLTRPAGPRRYQILGNTVGWIAAQRTGRHELPITVLEGIDDDTAALMIETGRDADPIAHAISLGELVALERDRNGAYGAVARVARRCGLGRTSVAHTLRLLELAPELRMLVRSGSLSTGHALILLRCPDPARREALARWVCHSGASVRALEARLRAAESRDRKSDAPAPDRPDIDRLTRDLGALFGCVVRLTRDALEIDFGGRMEVLSGVLERLGQPAGAAGPTLSIPSGCTLSLTERCLVVDHGGSTDVLQGFLEQVGHEER